MKEQTKAAYQQAVNRAVDYINAHLGEAMDLKALAAHAHVSEYHFHRLFTAFIGEAPGAYIMRLRLEYAAQKLQLTDWTLAAIAERTGYQSEQALSKAFRKHFGLAPSAFRNVQTYFAARTAYNTPEAPDQQPEIRELPALNLAYVRIAGPYGKEAAYRKGWSELLDFARTWDLLDRKEFYGLSFDDTAITLEQKLRFYACVATDRDFRPEGAVGRLQLEGGRFAVFALQGPYSGLNRLYQQMYFGWLPESGMRLRNALPFEKYLNNPDKVRDDEIQTEIYLPIQ